MSTPTPRTDEIPWFFFAREPKDPEVAEWILSAHRNFDNLRELARNLETELTTALARVAQLEKTIEGAYGETTHLRAQNAEQKRLINCANQYMPDLIKGAVSIDSITRQLSESQAQLASAKEEIEELQTVVNLVSQSLPASEDLELDELAKVVMQNLKDESERANKAEAQLTSAREDGCLTKDFCEAVIRQYDRLKNTGQTNLGQALIIVHEFDIEKVRSAIDAARGHLAETPAGGEAGQDAWQPIETAPKDGARMLIFCPSRTPRFTPPYITVGRFDTDSFYDMEDGDAVHPTHWAPLPPPPQGKEKQG